MSCSIPWSPPAIVAHRTPTQVRRGAEVHSAVELMHQTLLQGIADLNDLNALARECLARVRRIVRESGPSGEPVSTDASAFLYDERGLPA